MSSSSWKRSSIMILILILCCQFFACTPSPRKTSRPTLTPQQTVEGNLKIPSATVDPSQPSLTLQQPTATQEAVSPLHPPDPEASLAEGMGWLIYATQDEGLMAVNADGGGPNQLYDLVLDMYGLFDLPNGLISGRNPLIAMRVERPVEPGLELLTISMPNLAVTPVAAMISDEITSDPANQGGINIDINFAVMDEDATRWSPDGKYLAYVAASSGWAADIFTYDRTTGTIKQVTDCGTLAATPFWTPDGQRIIYQTVMIFDSAYDSLWIVNRNGSGNRNLLAPELSGVKATPIGFLNNATLLLKIEGWSESGLYLLDVNEGTLTLRSIGFVDSVDYDPVSGAFAFIDDTGALQFSPAPITYTERVDELDWFGHTIQWVPQLEGFWVFGPSGVYLLDLGGNLSQFSDADAYPSISNDGAISCLAGTTLECEGENGQVHTVTDSAYVQVLWGRSNDGFFYVDLTDLYYVSTEDYVPVLIDENLYPVEYLQGTLDLKNIGWLWLTD